jgi:hypothetical protein
VLFRRPDGYEQIKLTDDEGTSRTHKVHRLILLTFIGPCPDKETWTASHMNSVGHDKRIENLSWEPLALNVARQVPNGTSMIRARGEGSPNSKLTADDVRAIRAAYAARTPRDPQRGPSALARRYGVSRQTIKLIVAGRAWKHVEQEAA